MKHRFKLDKLGDRPICAANERQIVTMMVHIFPTGRKKKVARFLLPLILAVAVLTFFIVGFTRTSSATAQEQQAMAERAIRNALISCYAIEGVYPQNISHLKDRYGLVIDEQRYVVFYDILGSNIFPNFRVVPVNEDDAEGF